MGTVRKRFWWESALAVVSLGLAILTAAVPQWIEVLFGVDPDGGNGLLEAGIAVAALAGLVCAVLARFELKRPVQPSRP